MNSLSRFSVPVFVIISGWYMLNSRPDSRRLAEKCGKLFLLMLAWSGIYYCQDLLCGSRSFGGFGELWRYLLTNPVHLWYIYAIIVLYAFTPLFYVFAEHAGKGEYRYALGMTFAFGSIAVILARSGWFPTLETVLAKMQVPYLMGMPFMYLLGGYLRRHGLGPTARRAVYALGYWALSSP